MVDLMEALKASVAAAKKGGDGRQARREDVGQEEGGREEARGEEARRAQESGR